MTAPIDERLIRNATSSVDALLNLLVEGLGWPLPPDLESIPLLPWEPEELGLDAEKLGKLTSIRQVPKLTTKQPFGVFVLTFAGGQLPIGAIRRLVDQLVRKQRARRKAGPTSQWNLGDLVFFCHNGDGHGSVHVVALKDDNGHKDLRTISWSSQLTPTRLSLLSRHALAGLVWPEGDVSLEHWRKQWSGAFTSGYREGVRTAKALSQRMAEVAADIRDEIRALITVETESGPLHKLLNDLKARLNAGLDPEAFADVFAQTLVYGLLTSRISNPEKFMAAEGKALLDFENPFLDAIYSGFRRHADDALDLDHLGLVDLAHTLAESDVDSLLADFGSSDSRDDAVLYLYEEFLDKYDREQRRRLGAYYTPIPLVQAILRLAHHALQSVCGLPLGLSDASSRGEWAKQRDALDEISDPDSPAVTFLDPATGTGTFLLQLVRLMKEQGQEIDEKTLGRIAALEISLASYAVAHLKMGLEIDAALRKTRRLPIYLADTLSMGREYLAGMEDPVSRESAQADEIKHSWRASVIVGNPPYQRLARSEGGGWITDPPPGQRDIFEDVLAPARHLTVFSNQRSIYNLYVYFWRWAIWKAFEENESGPAVVAFVTASSWLDGEGFLGLRRLARQVADEIWVMDLGGNNRGARSDENVFGIETGVAVVLLVRAAKPSPDKAAKVRYSAIRGSKSEKLKQLATLDFGSTSWLDVNGDWFDPLSPRSSGDGWEMFPLLTDLLPWQQPGCVVSRTWPIAPSKDVLLARWRKFVSIRDPQERGAAFATAKTGRNIFTRIPGRLRLVDETIANGTPPIVEYGYRAFDTQFIIDDVRLIKTEGPALWASMSDQQCFMVSQTKKALGSGPGAVMFTAVPDFASMRGSDGGKDVLPLYRDSTGTPNCDPQLLKYLSENLKLDVSAEDLFAYIFGILAGTNYTDRFAEQLQIPGQRIPLSRDPALFRRMSSHGAQLIQIQTNGTRYNHVPKGSPQRKAPVWLKEPTSIPETARDYAYLEENETLVVGGGTLLNVPLDVWEFNVGGMQVMKKWLSWRTATGAGRAASGNNVLDSIRSKRWEPDWSKDLATLVDVLGETVDMRVIGVGILDEMLTKPLFDSSAVPMPSDFYRSVPKTVRKSPSGEMQLDL